MPKNKFQDDCFAVYKWILQNSADLGIFYPGEVIK